MSEKTVIETKTGTVEVETSIEDRKISVQLIGRINYDSDLTDNRHLFTLGCLERFGWDKQSGEAIFNDLLARQQALREAIEAEPALMLAELDEEFTDKHKEVLKIITSVNSENLLAEFVALKMGIDRKEAEELIFDLDHHQYEYQRKALMYDEGYSKITDWYLTELGKKWLERGEATIDAEEGK
jgi:hypothetical protein